jgi:hypothetical protein
MNRLLRGFLGASLPLSICSCGSSGDASHGPSYGADGGGTDAPLVTDATNDVASDASTPVDAPADTTDAGADACTGAVAVVGGTVAGASTIAFGATLLQGGTWTVSSLATNVGSPPAIAATPGGFVGAFVDANGQLEYATSSWSWSSPAGVAGVSAKGSPSLALVGTPVHLVYQGDDGKYYHGTYSAGSGWDAADDPIGGAAKQGFGPGAPVAANVAGDLVIAYGGQDGFLYDETWSAGAWAPDDEHATATVGLLSPAIVALQGGTSDALIAYVATDTTIHWTSRTAGAWSAPALVSATAFTDASPSLAALDGGRAVMAFLGTNGLPYFSLYQPASTPLWSTPAAIGTSATTLVSPPSVAPGVCGDDAVAVLTGSAGVAVVRYAGGAWLPPTVLPGTAGMTYASVASQP